MISFTILLHFVKCHRDHFLQLCRGQRSFAQSVSVSPAELVGKGLEFSGYQIAYALWGFLLFGVIFGVVSFLALLIKYQMELHICGLGVDLIETVKSTAISLIPVMVMNLMIWMFQYLLTSVVFRDRVFPNISVSIDNRRLHSIMSYFFFFFNILMGLFSCLARIIKGLVLGILFVSRIDRTSLMLGFQQWDKGFVAYLGFLHVLVAHRHPVMLVFCELLNTRGRNPESGQSLELSASNTPKEQESSHEKRMATAYPREIRDPRFSQKAVNRWLLAITLLRNPSLLQHRRQWYSSPIGMIEADTASITVLVQ